MMMKLLSFLCIPLLLITSCSENDDVRCYSFDIRACHADPWVSKGGGSDQTVSDRQAAIKDYLSSQGIVILTIGMDLDYPNEITCRACVVCPEGPRVFIVSKQRDGKKLKRLELLNFTEDNCID